MRKSILPAGVLAVASLSQAATYSGNGAGGFGGPIGSGSLSITESGGNITFVVTPASDVGDNKIALYLDTKAGGFTSTAGFTDEGDYGRKIITGGTTNNGSAGGATTHSTVNFAPGFGADFALSINPNDYIGLFALDSASNYTYKTGTGSAGSPFTVTVSRTDLGLGPTDGFSIVGSYLSGTFYRSNETFGASTTASDSGASPNAGFNGSVTFTSSLAYSVPEPASLAVLGLGAAGLLRRRK